MSHASPGPAGPNLAPPPVSADIGLVAALSIEVSPFFGLLGQVRRYSTQRHSVIEGELGGKIVVAILCGPGRKAARGAAELLIAGHRPRWLLSAGFGGALAPELNLYDIVVGNAVIDPEGTRLGIDIRLPADASNRRIRTSAIATVDAIVRTATEKAEIRRRTGADVVDMETSAVAGVCSERNIPFLAVRVISDEADKDLPPEIATILGRSGGYRIGATLGALWHRPSCVKDLWKLREHAIEASDRLADFLPGLIAQLP